MNQALLDYYRCPADLIRLAPAADLPNETGFFHFGADVVGFGQCRSGVRPKPSADLPDALEQTKADGNGNLVLPFDLSSVVENLRLERYAHSLYSPRESSWLHDLYYVIRPATPGWVRRWIQRAYFSGWNAATFPNWPVDSTVDRLLERVLLRLLESRSEAVLPFIWFWPDNYRSCALVTHDVETTSGREFCAELMDLDDSFSIKSAFQIIPEKRYHVSPEWLDAFRARGFEVNVHDLSHDGQLFRHHEGFVKRAEMINRYGEVYGAKGFRSGILYRRVEWYEALGFEYDMSLPNVAHLDPQRGGCCTVMPFFIGKILELPTTATQDYSLFHILRDYSIDLWKRQLELIGQRHGLASFIIHPDYVLEAKARKVYTGLLSHLDRLRADECLWIAKPGEVNSWWRQRSQMELVRDGNEWKIEGPGKERARLAFASVRGGSVKYEFASQRQSVSGM